MSGVHKYPTISFRVSPIERTEIEARIFTSGLQKKDYFIRSCLNNRVCVVGTKEHVFKIVEELKNMENNLLEAATQLQTGETMLTPKGIEEMKEDYLAMLQAFLWMLDGAKYLWESKEKVPANPTRTM